MNTINGNSNIVYVLLLYVFLIFLFEVCEIYWFVGCYSSLRVSGRVSVLD